MGFFSIDITIILCYCYGLDNQPCFKLESYVCRSDSVTVMERQWARVNTFSLSEVPRAVCRPNTQSMTPRYKRMKLNVWQGPRQKQHFTKYPPPPTGLPSLLRYPSPSLFTALFRGEPILFHSLALIFSFVNPSFWPGIMQQNIKATLILKKMPNFSPPPL